MANRNFRSQFSYSWAAQTVTLRLRVDIAGTGAPTLASGTGMGVTSITRNSAGDYSILLANNYAALMACNVMFNSGASAPAAPLVNIESQAVSTLAAPILRLQCRDLSGVATDPATGEAMYIQIVLNNSPSSY